MLLCPRAQNGWWNGMGWGTCRFLDFTCAQLDQFGCLDNFLLTFCWLYSHRGFTFFQLSSPRASPSVSRSTFMVSQRGVRNLVAYATARAPHSGCSSCTRCGLPAKAALCVKCTAESAHVKVDAEAGEELRGCIHGGTRTQDEQPA